MAARNPRNGKSFELWLSRALHFAVVDDQKLFFKRKDVTIIYDAPSIAIFRLATKYLICDFVVDHVPHLGRPKEERDQ